MFPVYEEKKKNLHIHLRTSAHASPHLHNSIEFIYITEGTLELGMGQELFHMEEGDFAVIFPDVIHHYQVFSPGENRAVYLWAKPALTGQFADIIQNSCPEDPVIKKEQVHRDIINAVQCLRANRKEKDDILVVEQAYVQILLARSIPCFHMMEKSSVESNDIIYQTVSYIARHFREEVSLDRMARDLGVSKFTLSRVFSGTFHRNFNQYLHDARLGFACQRLETTNDTITEICLDSDFESQRTFNRAFKERFKMSPSQYRILQQRQQEEKEEQYGVFDNDDQGTEKHCTDRT